jgi:predicted DCC family thiol-disulfide oxidoreductase YuxK
MNTSDPPPVPSATVYYNSACPVCKAGIAHQRGQMQDCAVEWIDVHTRPELARELDIDLETLRERLLVRDADGKLHVGDRAFVMLWSQTRGQRWLAWLARPFAWLSGPLYKLVARQLYHWNRRRGHW